MKKKLHYAWIVLVGCCGLTSTMGIILNTGGQWFASVTGELGFSTTELGLYLTVCSLGLGLAAPFVGRLLPKANIRVLLTACALASVAALGAMAFYDAPWQWWVSGAVIGLAGGFVFLVPAPIILGNWFAKKTGFVVGIAMACTGIAAAIMNPIVATLIASLGWRTTYLVTAAIAAIIVLPCTLFLIRFKPEDKGLLPYGAEAFTAEGVQSSGAPSSASEGVSAKRAYHSLAFWLLFFAFVAFSMLGGFSQLLPLYMSNVGLTAIVGLIATMVMIGQFSGTLGLGAVSDRFGGLVAGMLGSGIVLGGFLLLIFFGNLAPSALGGGLFYGVALSLSSVTPALLCRDAFGNKDFASLYSTLMFAVSAVGAFGMTIITLILDTTGSFYPALWFGVALCVAAAAAVITSLKLAKRLPREA